MDKKTTPLAEGQGRKDDVPGGNRLSIPASLGSASVARTLRRVLDGIEKRRREGLPPEQIVAWTFGILQNLIAHFQRDGDRRGE